MQYFNYPDSDRKSTDSELTVLKDLSEDDWSIIANCAEYIHFSAGDRLLSEGESDNGAYILVSGSVEVLGKRSFGGQKVIAEIKEGSIFGELAFFDAQPRIASIRALTKGQVLHLTHAGLDQIADRNPKLARQLIFDMGRVLAYRFRLAASSIL